jgi:hypothetical protein
MPYSENCVTLGNWSYLRKPAIRAVLNFKEGMGCKVCLCTGGDGCHAQSR